MSNHRIVCTEQTDNCPKYGHIIAVGIGDDPNKASDRKTVDQVWAALDAGQTFYTYGGGKVALVHKHWCGCGRKTLRSAADCTTLNNLDSLRVCAFAA